MPKSVGVPYHRLVNLCARHYSGWLCKDLTRGLYWFGRNVPTSSSSTRALALKFAVGVTNGRKRNGLPRSLVVSVCVVN